MKRAEDNYYQYVLAPDADVHVATHWETAETLLSISGIRRAYFMQHFEPVFEKMDSVRWHRSFLTYSAPIHKIANSSWCKSTVERYLTSQGLRQTVHLATNAIDQQVFHPSTKVRGDKTIRVISYGGRGVEWKGFELMAQAVAAARVRLGGDAFEWCVYGDAILPPDNGVARYNHLGFLFPDQLAEEYRRSDVLLSASWYESFPLFPIEAMACGLAVITSQKGTEGYAVNGESCLVVDPHDVSSISDAICRLVLDEKLRFKLSSAAKVVGRESTWEIASHKMEAALEQIKSAPEIPYIGRDQFFASI